MKRMLLALLCAAPLVAGTPVEGEMQALPAQESQVIVETAYFTSMGCDVADCTDPTHYHYCLAGCTDPVHYHSCPVGCTDPTHPHCGQCWETTTEAVPEFWSSMGCDLADCTDPTHYHHCGAGCTAPTHYHDCPVGCENAAHGHMGGCYRGGSRGHHGGRHH